MTTYRFGVGLALTVSLAVPCSAVGQTLPSDNADATVAEQPAISLSPAPIRPYTPSFGALFRGLGADFGQMASKDALLLMGVGGGVALGAHAFDQRLATTPFGGASAARMFGPGQLAGSLVVQGGAAFATYLVGRATGSARLAQVGAELTRAQIVAQGVTQTFKFGTQRTRPDGTTLSFPSGHTSSAFATATVLQREFGWKAGIPAYVGAAWIGASRVQAERHYLSDVVAGATIGILAGRAVTVGRGDARFSLGPSVVPGGIGISFSKIRK